MTTTELQARAAWRIVTGHRALARLNRKLARTYQAAGCECLADPARRVAHIEADRAAKAMLALRVFRAIGEVA